MEAIGFQPLRFQLAAYVISGMMAGWPGACWPTRRSSSARPIMTWQRSGELIFMVVLGGLGSLHGADHRGCRLPAAGGVPAGNPAWPKLHSSPRDPCSSGGELEDGLRPLLILIVLFVRGGIMGLLRRPHHG